MIMRDASMYLAGSLISILSRKEYSLRASGWAAFISLYKVRPRCQKVEIESSSRHLRRSMSAATSISDRLRRWSDARNSCNGRRSLLAVMASAWMAVLAMFFNYIAISLGMIRRYIQIPATLSSLVLILRRRVHKLIKVQGKENGSN